jgi:hypothetical protein
VSRVIRSVKRSLLLAGAASLLTVVALPLLGGFGATGAGAATSTPAATGDSLSASPASVVFGGITVGDFGAVADPVTLTNTSTSPVTVTGVTIGGADYEDFSETDNCDTVAAGSTCTVEVTFQPGALGLRSATLTPVVDGAAEPVIPLTGTGTEGYYEVTAQGAVAAYGDANSLGDLTGTTLTKPIVASATTGDDSGYWLAASDGGVFTYGTAGYFGSTGAIHLNKPIVGMAATVDDDGYWLVASDGGVFTFGDANFYGSTGAIRLNQPIVGLTPTPDDQGYWLVASDGGIFAFGDAIYYGSTGAIHLNKPIVGMASTPDGGGYWLVASDGGIFTFGDATFDGSAGAIHLTKPIVGMAATPDGGGYWLMASDGGIFTFGDAPFDGSASGTSASPFVTIAGDGTTDRPGHPRPAGLPPRRPRGPPGKPLDI